MKIGICKYCLEQKNLVESHLIPKAVYRRTSMDGRLIRQSANEVRFTNAQLKEYLLCAECDESLSINGENWTLPLLADKDGRFAIHDLLVRLPQLVVADDVRVYAARNSDIDINKLTHFSAAIFWKASVHSWIPGRVRNLIELGRYREELRKFLRNEGPFPKHVALTVFIQPSPVKSLSFCPPYYSRSAKHHTHNFYVLGIMFMLRVGKQIGPDAREECFYSNSNHPLFLYDHSGHIDSILQALTTYARISPQVLANAGR